MRRVITHIVWITHSTNSMRRAIVNHLHVWITTQIWCVKVCTDYNTNLMRRVITHIVWITYNTNLMRRAIVNHLHVWITTQIWCVELCMDYNTNLLCRVMNESIACMFGLQRKFDAHSWLTHSFDLHFGLNTNLMRWASYDSFACLDYNRFWCVVELWLICMFVWITTQIWSHSSPNNTIPKYN